MSEIAQHTLEAMSQRRAAGERVSALAAELGMPWQRLEKLTRGVSRPIPDDPTLITRELRYTRLMLNSVPSLGCNKPWALAWRERICGRLRSRMDRLRRRLALLAGEAQVKEPAAKFWKPRPSSPADERMRRLYDPNGTDSLWGAS